MENLKLQGVETEGGKLTDLKLQGGNLNMENLTAGGKLSLETAGEEPPSLPTHRYPCGGQAW